MAEKQVGMLSPYRVLDLTDEKGWLCGKIMGDLGADVIKIEPPGGDPGRNIGPFYHDEPNPEKSLYWFAFNTSKRGITLDIEKDEGKKFLKKILKTADFVVESFPPGYMEKLGLGYKDLAKLNPSIILVSITPFGQTGPYKDYKASDIISWAMGGMMYPHGDADRPPVRMSNHSHAYMHAGSEAAVGALMALHYRSMTGEGQHVDVSIQECVARAGELGVSIPWATNRVNRHRGEVREGINIPSVWQCKDGYVVYIYWTGNGGKLSASFVEWMDSEGMATDFLKNLDWTKLDYTKTTQEIVDQITEPTRKFMLAHTKSEIYEGGVKSHAMAYPINDISDTMKDIQLAARNFWVKLSHPELNTSIVYPGAFALTSELPPQISRRAPLIGEHNREIFENELKISRTKVQTLKNAGVI
jgi:crotonobetainyl-CoA:carnitine CoA-transferase CaiB-like acyl-CoA transferase